jgi:hypothetical protein
MLSNNDKDILVLIKTNPETKSDPVQTKITVHLSEDDDGTIVMWATGVTKGSRDVYYTKKYSLPAPYKGFSDRIAGGLYMAIHNEIFNKGEK